MLRLIASVHKTQFLSGSQWKIIFCVLFGAVIGLTISTALFSGVPIR